MPLGTILAAGALTLLGGGLGATTYLQTPESSLDLSKLKWLDGTDFLPTKFEEVQERLALAEQLLLEETGKLPELDQSKEIEEELWAEPMLEETLDERGEDGRPTAQARATHQAAVTGLLPTYGNRKRSGKPSSKAFIRHWVAKVRLQFPMRANKPSDKAAMMKWLGGELMAVGIRPSHAEAAGQVVIHLALLPSAGERLGQAIFEERLPRTHGARLLYNIRKTISGLWACSTERIELAGG